MDSSAPRLATYADLAELPEILAGEIVTAPAPLPRHAFVAGALTLRIRGHFGHGEGGGPGGWWILAEVDVRFTPHDIVRPDLVGWRTERLTAPWETRPIDVRPDWVCGVLSPTTRGHDTIRKARLYAQHGVPHYWLVDPEARTLEARVLQGDRWVVASSHEAGEVAAIAPFEAVPLELSRLFPPAS